MLAVQMDWDLFHQYANVMSPRTMVVVTVLVAVSIWLVFQLRARYREDAGRADDEFEMLTQFRELHQRGELTEEEYRLIRSRLAREAGARMSVTSVRRKESAEAAVASVQQECGTEKAGETGQDGTGSEESRTTDEPPNQNSVQ